MGEAGNSEKTTGGSLSEEAMQLVSLADGDQHGQPMVQAAHSGHDRWTAARLGNVQRCWECCSHDTVCTVSLNKDLRGEGAGE